MQKTRENLGTQQETKMGIAPITPQVKGQCVASAPGLQFQCTATHLSTFKGVFPSEKNIFTLRGLKTLKICNEMRHKCY